MNLHYCVDETHMFPVACPGTGGRGRRTAGAVILPPV